MANIWTPRTPLNRLVTVDQQIASIDAMLGKRPPTDHDVTTVDKNFGGRITSLGKSRRNRVVFHIGVHPDEPLGVIVTQWFAEFYLLNQALFEQLDVGFDLIYSDLDGLRLQDGWIGNGQPQHRDFVLSSMRDTTASVGDAPTKERTDVRCRYTEPTYPATITFA
jgi:hypothetical protein